MNRIIFVRLARRAETIKQDVHAVYLAARDPLVPWYARIIALFVVGYALSPIDLIPDFVPIFGYLDDIVVVPLGILLVIKMIPDDVLAKHRATAALAQKKPSCMIAAFVIITTWVVLAVVCGRLAYQYFST